MQVLFIHQNFPAQFVHLAAALAARPGTKVFGLGENANRAPPSVTHARYPKPKGFGEQTHRYLKQTEAAIRRGQAVAQACAQLLKRDVKPDVIYCHPGWGEGLYLRDVFPDARIVHYCEYYYRSTGGDVGFEPGREVSLDDMARVRTMNITQLLSLEAADWCTSPTLWQRSRYPAWVRRMTSVVHEGVNPDFSTPEGPRQLQLPDGKTLSAEDEVVTYIARNLEPYRGFHRFMQALPEILGRRPKAQALIVGGEERGYGPVPGEGKSWKQVILEGLGDKLDLSRVHFVGRLPHDALQTAMRISRAHVYLTYPFVLSWSAIEAMGCGALVVGSDTAPVREVIQDGVNGLLVPFHDPSAIAAQVVRAVSNPREFDPLRRAARQLVVERFHLRDVILPQQIALVDAIAAGKPGSAAILPPLD